MKERIFDVIIVGAGAAGLYAAWQLSLAGKSCAILEARDRAGGRIHTLMKQTGQPVELGAEFIHGALPRTTELCKQAGITLLEAGGEAYRQSGTGWEPAEFVDDYVALEAKFSSLTGDLPVAQFLEEHFASAADRPAAESLRMYTEGYNAADVTFASTMALRKDLTDSGEEEQQRPKGGYGVLVKWLVNELNKSGVVFGYATPVTGVHWQRGHVDVTTAGGGEWQAQKVIITVPLGVLQKGDLHFAPALLRQQEAWQALRFGNVVKIVLHFETAFWKPTLGGVGGGETGGFFLSTEEVPTWWTQIPIDTPFITGWLGGPKASFLLERDETVILAAAMKSLSHLFNVPMDQLQGALIASYFTNWANDPFARGAYSYKAVGDEVPKQLLKQGVADTIYFCGEAFYEGSAAGTVEAALHSAFETVQRILENRTMV